MARFFIDRPVFAIVISLFLILAGLISLAGLPVAQYPQIALPTVAVKASYLGASSDVVESSVSTPLDQQINGVTDLLYIKTVSGDDGSTSITVTLRLERDPDLAAVEVQNRVSQAQSKLPPEVVNAGVTTAKQSPDTLMYLVLHSPAGTYDTAFLTNYAYVNVVDELKRVKGVGDVQVFASEFGMRIWLKPDRMATLGLTASDIVAAIKDQNVQAPAGQVGQPPAGEGQSFQYSLRVRGRLVEASEFENIVVRSKPDGSFIRVKDVARVELGLQSYTQTSELSGKPAATIGIKLAPGANALESAGGAARVLESLRPNFPPGLEVKVIYDNTEFVRASIGEVIHTFVEALILVLIVVFLFLQNWRATLIPMLAVPVSLVATFIAYQALGFSVNTLSLFGMVLAIGIVVDDAIVVVEAVEHIMHAQGLPAKEATRQAMDEVSGPVIAIALVLCAVFVPMAFVPGVTGQLYKQFALTVAVSTLFSALVALTLTPALCTILLKPRPEGGRPGPVARFFASFNRGFEWVTHQYGRAVSLGLRRTVLVVATMAILFAAITGLFRVTPSGFVPDEDNGVVFMMVILPDASSQGRTLAATREVQGIARSEPDVEDVLAIVGFDVISGTAASNASFVIARLKPWADRKEAAQHAFAIAQRLRGKTARIPEASVAVFNPPALPGFGAVSGFSLMLQGRSGQTPRELAQGAQLFIEAARKRKAIGAISTTFSARTPSYVLDVDREKAKKLGVPVNDVFTALQTFMGGYQVNDFTRFGRNYKVTVQADTSYRREVDDIAKLFVRNAGGAMLPLDTLITARRDTGARFLQRFNLYPTAEFSGSPAPGYSSGDAIAALEASLKDLPPGFGISWSGTSLQEIEAGNRATVVMALSVVVVFLFLAALYESWAVPFAVLLAVPFGVLGALVAILARGLDFNVYGQIGLVTLVGLAAKNAILIVEFAKMYHEQGKPLADAALEAAKLRLRPIIMTSFAFILGVVPLVIAGGAGAASKHSVGTVVFGGMLAATLLAILAVPALYVIVQGLAERVGGAKPDEAPAAGDAE
jgi:multidrug efflux pump